MEEAWWAGDDIPLDQLGSLIRERSWFACSGLDDVALAVRAENPQRGVA
ncbi:MAG: hypothetical protein ACI8TP_005111, partial [Acidimicrobiales bacterium]